MNAAQGRRQQADTTIMAVPFDLAAQAQALGEGVAAVERWAHDRIDNRGQQRRSDAHG